MKEIAIALQFLGIVEVINGNSSEARALFEESLGISRRINNKQAMPRVLMHLGGFSQMDGDYLTAWRNYEEALAICRDIQEVHLTHVVLSTMGYFALTQKNCVEAREYYKEALEICLKLKNKRTIAETLLGFAEILCAEARYAHSARLQGFAESLFKEAQSLTETHLTNIKKSASALKRYLREDSYQKEFDIGKTLKLEQAVEIAIRQEE
jgi:tetratricopeptide (TPR) repeat protein